MDFRKDVEYIKDYYLEEGRVIFTEKHLLKRGVCCFNNCRHCPYNKEEHTTD